MNIVVIDGQGGGIGRALVAGIKSAMPDCSLTAVGTNSAATVNMQKGGADRVATGENAVIVAARKADVIVGPVGIAIADALLGEVLSLGDSYGSDTLGNGKTICIDFSSINIAKPFHIGHLSTTVIGSALCKIFRFLGYKVVGINHLGDYGTQFGKLIVAFKKWSSEEEVLKGRLKELTRIYVKFHEEAEKDPALDDEARRYFKLIEDGDTESNKLFELFKKITLEEVDKIYELLKQSGYTIKKEYPDCLLLRYYIIKKYL